MPGMEYGLQTGQKLTAVGLNHYAESDFVSFYCFTKNYQKPTNLRLYCLTSSLGQKSGYGITRFFAQRLTRLLVGAESLSEHLFF